MSFGTILFGGMLYCVGLAWLCVSMWELMGRFGGKHGKN